MKSTIFLLSVVTFFIVPSLCDLDDSWVERQKSPEGYRYRLDNECYLTLRSQLITVPPEQQQLVFDFIALNISDVRMYPSSCRRSSIWLLCTLAFPSVEEDPSDTQDVCVVGEEECEYVSDLCLGLLDCEALEDFYPKGDEGGLCPRLEESVGIPVEVQTCLKSETKTTQCCFDPYVIAESTGECVVKCPASAWDQGDVEAISYVMFGFLWFSVFVSIVGLVPLLFLKGSLSYPKAFVPMGLVTVMLWTFTKLWGVFVGIDEWVCDGEEDGAVATLEFFESSRCSAQLFFLNYFSSLVCVQMVSVASIFLLMVINPNAKIIFTLKPIIYCSLVFIPLALAVTVTLFNELGDYDDMVFMSLGNSCQVNLSEHYGILLTVFYTICFCTTYILTIAAIVKLFMRSWQLFRVHAWPMLFLGLMTYISSLLMVLFFRVIPDGVDNFSEYEEGLFCVAFHAQDKDYPCKTQFTDGFVFYCFVEVSIAFVPILAALVLFWNSISLGWWTKLLVHHELAKSVETVRQSKRSSTSYEEESKTYLPDTSRVMRLQEERKSKRTEGL